MASPQLEDGYTRIANEIIEKLVTADISGQELKTVLVVLRFTYGYSKKYAQISYGTIAKALGISRQRAMYHIKRLVSRMILGGLKGETRMPGILWFNKDFEKWLPVPKGETSPKGETMGVPKGEYRSVPKGETTLKKERKRKENIITLPDFISPELWRDFQDHRRKIRKPMTVKAEELMIKKLTRFRDQGEDPVHLIEIMIEKGWQSIELDWIKGKESNEDGFTKFLRRHAQDGKDVGEETER